MANDNTQQMEAFKQAYRESQGTDSPTVTLEQSQATTAETTDQTGSVKQAYREWQATGDAENTPTTQAVSEPGKGAPNEDANDPTVYNTTVAINASSQLGSSFSPQPNVLDQFASYTYSLSLYLVPPDQFKKMEGAATSKVDISSWSLIMQSGGAPGSQQSGSQTGGVGISNAQSVYSVGRNKYFSLDYYIDNLTFETSYLNHGMSTIGDLEFTVIEPNGITLAKNLTHAIMDMYKDAKAQMRTAFFAMVIRFYGYDSNGNLVTKVTPNAAKGPTANNAVVVKYLPFMLSEYHFTVTNKAVEYQFKGTYVSVTTAKSTGLGSIPGNWTFSGETLDDILNGKDIDTIEPQAKEPDRAATNKPSPSNGAPKNPPSKPLYNPSEGILNGGNGGGTSTEALGVGVDY